MTTSSQENSSLSWLHCNVCHRAFASYNQMRTVNDRLVLAHSSLRFFFSGCGHFFCENCIHERERECKICHEQTSMFRIDGTVPEKVAMFLRPPVALLEDSLSVMMVGSLLHVQFKAHSSFHAVSARKCEPADFGTEDQDCSSKGPAGDGTPGASSSARAQAPSRTRRAARVTRWVKYAQESDGCRRIQSVGGARHNPPIDSALMRHSTPIDSALMRHNTPIDSALSQTPRKGVPALPHRNSLQTRIPPSSQIPLQFTPLPVAVSDSPVIHNPGRLSLRSPSLHGSYSPMPGGTPLHSLGTRTLSTSQRFSTHLPPSLSQSVYQPSSARGRHSTAPRPVQPRQ